MNSPDKFVEALSEVRLANTFNPYKDTCPIHDAPDAAERRKENLKLCLEACIEDGADTIWIARDLGYRGGRRTGIALTDEAHLLDASAMYGGANLRRATNGLPVAERTATTTWGLLRAIGRPVMLWNVFPFHPHAPLDPMTNRCHKKSEREATWPFMLALLEMLKPTQLVAIGRDAGLALTSIDVEVSTVRHPSYGGQAEFVAGVQDIYGIRPVAKPPVMATLPFAEFA